jgi:hypothetical protein
MARERKVTPVSRERYRNGDPIRPDRGCNHCYPVLLDGVLTHEAGCQAAWKDCSTKCLVCGAQFYREMKPVRICPACLEEGQRELALLHDQDDDHELADHDTRLKTFFEAYVECALQNCKDARGKPLGQTYSLWDLAGDALKEMSADCALFLGDHIDVIGDKVEQAGHDFWITRCGLGAGFWDDERWPDLADNILTAGAQAFGPTELCVGADELIHVRPAAPRRPCERD